MLLQFKTHKYLFEACNKFDLYCFRINILPGEKNCILGQTRCTKSSFEKNLTLNLLFGTIFNLFL